MVLDANRMRKLFGSMAFGSVSMIEILNAVSLPTLVKLMVYCSCSAEVSVGRQPAGETDIILGSHPARTVSMIISVLLDGSVSPTVGLIET